MWTTLRRRGAVYLVAWAALALATPRSPAQTVSPSYSRVGTGLTGSAASLTSTTSTYVSPMGYANPGGYPGSYPYYPYYPSYYYDPYSSYLYGAASVFNSQGQFLINREQSNLLKEQVKQAQLDTRRKAFEEWQYERANTPTLQDLREQVMRQEQRRAFFNPPVTEVWSGYSLNRLLEQIQGHYSAQEPNVPLRGDVVQHINVMPAGKGGSLGALRPLDAGEPPAWPLVLAGDDFKAERDGLNDLLQRALAEAKSDKGIQTPTLKDVQAKLERLRKRLEERVDELTPNQYVAALRFLSQLDDAARALQQSDVKLYMTRLNRVQNVAELVREMRDKGLQFAPAANGDESYYVALRQALAAYSAALQNQPPAPKD